MITLVLAAGKSQRFKDAGYDIPKQLLTMPGGNLMIHHILAPLNNPLLVIQKENLDLYWPEVGLMSLENNHGPLNTAGQVIQHFVNVYPDEELLVVYSDVLFRDYDRFLLKCRLDNCDSGVVLFPASGDRFDYHSEGWAYGCAYYFESFNRFLIEAKTKLPDADLKDNLYGSICTYKVRASQHIDLGTPEDYEEYIRRCK